MIGFLLCLLLSLQGLETEGLWTSRGTLGFFDQAAAYLFRFPTISFPIHTNPDLIHLAPSLDLLRTCESLQYNHGPIVLIVGWLQHHSRPRKPDFSHVLTQTQPRGPALAYGQNYD